MKKIIPLLALIIIIATSCVVVSSNTNVSALPEPATATYAVVNDLKNPSEKILKGDINRHLLETDTIKFKWFRDNMKFAYPDAGAINTLKTYGDSVRLVVFCGTWCHDSQNLIPVFYKMVQNAGYNEKNISMIAVDRNKEALNNMAAAFHITNVPTFIVMRNGKEVGRVVEYGSYGQPEKEVGEIILKNYK